MENIKNKMIIEKIGEHRAFYKFTEKNKKGETLVVEISETFVDNNLKSDTLPKLWKKHGFTNKLYDNYLNINCYVTDKKRHLLGQIQPNRKIVRRRKKKCNKF